jgi:hypothetical protein
MVGSLKFVALGFPRLSNFSTALVGDEIMGK